MCDNCNSFSYFGSCNVCNNDPCTCSTPCTNCGEGIQLDAGSVFYHKNLTSTSALTNLDIANGATLDLILETIDAQLGQLAFSDFPLVGLRSLGYEIDTLQEFAEVVSAEIASLHGTSTGSQTTVVTNWLGNLSSDPGAAVDGQYWYNKTSNLLKIKVNNGVVKVITIS